MILEVHKIDSSIAYGRQPPRFTDTLQILPPLLRKFWIHLCTLTLIHKASECISEYMHTYTQHKTFLKALRSLLSKIVINNHSCYMVTHDFIMGIHRVTVERKLTLQSKIARSARSVTIKFSYLACRSLVYKN